MDTFILKTAFSSEGSGQASEFLAGETGLSSVKIKDAMNKGAVWIKDKKGRRRLRRAKTTLRAGDCIEFYYNKDLLSLKPPAARCLSDLTHYSVWFKPTGLLAQGTMYGDHCSLMRQAELFFNPRRKVFPVHRLDREVSGLMLIAHHREAAARLSALFKEHRIIKRYRVGVLRNPAEKIPQGRIDLPLDGKTASTEFAIVSYDPARDTATLDVTIKTGRLHQIRRHFALIGCPVLGDPKYGRGNKNKTGISLSAVSLLFRCPFSHQTMEFTLPREESTAEQTAI